MLAVESWNAAVAAPAAAAAAVASWKDAVAAPAAAAAAVVVVIPCSP